MVNQSTVQQQPAFRSGDRIVGGSAARLIQIVYFRESNTGGVVYAAHDRGVVAYWQICNDRRLVWISRSQAAIHDILDLVLSDDPADNRVLPVVVRCNRSTVGVMQFQCRISQRIRNTILAELRANGADDHSLLAGSLDNEPANHHVVARLNKGARGDVPKLRTRYYPVEPEHLIGFRRVYAASCSPTAPTRADSKAATRILPGGRVIRRDCAIAPAPLALGAERHVGLDLNP